jgi:fibronectin-binding autotransporter adhesin
MKAGQNRASVVYCRVLTAILPVGAMLFLARPAVAASLTWDASGAGMTFDGVGVWSSTGINWWNSSSDGSWSTGSAAQFGVGSGGISQYTVTLGSPISASGLVFQNQNYTIAGGGNTLTLIGPSGITASVPATISAPLSLGGSQTWSVSAGNLLTVNGGVSGGYGLTISGGSTVLAGTNSYSGGTVVSSGKLFLNGPDNGTPTISVSAAATLGGSGGAASALATVATGGTLDLRQNTGSTFTLGAVTFAGSANLLVNDANGQYSTTPAMSVGTLTTGHGTSPVTVTVTNVPSGSGVMEILKYTGSILGGGYSSSTFKLKSPVNQGRNTYALSNSTSADAVILTYTADYLHWTGSLGTAWDTTTANWKLNSSGAATTYIDSPGDTVVFDDGAGTRSTVSLATVIHPTSVTFSNTSSSYILQGAGGIYGGGSLNVNGAGVVTIATSNGYTGGTNVSGGTLNDGAAGSLGAGPLAVSGGVANLVNPQSNSSVSLSGGLLNLGSSTAVGSGTLAISGGTLDNTSGTAMTLGNNSSLALNGSFIFRGSSPLSISAGAGVISGGPTLNVTASTLTVTSPIAGAGGLTKNGSGTLVLLGSNTFSGTTTVAAGSLVGNSASLSGPVNLTNNINLIFNQTSTGTFGQTISGNGGLTLMGGGVLTLSASQNYSHPTVVLSGTLQLQQQQLAHSIGIKFTTYRNSGGTYGVTGVAGVVPMGNWNNVAGITNTAVPLVDQYNNATSATVTWNSTNPWDTFGASQTDQNAQLMNSYLDCTSGPPSPTYVAVSGIPYSLCTVYVYFGSDGNGRTGSISLAPASGTTLTYDYSTDSNVAYTPGAYPFIKTTDTTGANPSANYCAFPGVLGSGTTTVSVNRGNNNSGIMAVEIVDASNQGELPMTPLILSASATLDLAGCIQTLPSLADLVPGNGGTVTNGLSGSLGALMLSPTGGSTTFSGTIQDGAGQVALVLAGSGMQVLTGTNSYSGATTISAGALSAIDGVGLPTTSNLVFAGSLAQTGFGAVFISSGTFSRAVGTAAGQVQWTGDGGFAAVGGPLTLIMSPNVPLIWGGTVNFVATGNVLTFGSATANNQVNFTDSLDLNGGTRQIDVAQGAGGDSVLFSGNVVDSATGGALLKTGAGTLILSGTDSYLGGTIVANGTLVLGSPFAIAQGSSLIVGAGGVAFFAPSASAPDKATPAGVEAVPEPGTIALLAAAIGGALAHRRWRRARPR